MNAPLRLSVLALLFAAASIGTATTACSSQTVVDAPGGGGAGTGGGATGGGGSGTGGAGFDECNGPGQCVVAVPGCCGTCGMPTLASVEPIASTQQDEFYAATCPNPEGTPCPGCASFPNGNLFAYCEGGRCREADMTASPFSACTQPSDCALRWGTGCCPGCSGSWEPGLGGDLVAVATSQLAAFTSEVCAGDVACDDCAPDFPPGAAADCIAGHCAVIELATP